MGLKSVLNVLLLGLVLTAGPLLGQTPPSIAASLHPAVVIPLGNSVDYYRIGYGASVSGRYDLTPLLSLRAGLDVNLIPTLGDTTLSLFSLGFGPDLELSLPLRLRMSLFLTGGWYLGMHEGQSGNNPFLKGGAEIFYDITAALGVGLGAYYRHYFTATAPLLSGLSAELGLSYHFGRMARTPGLKIQSIEIPPLFPVFFKYYDDHPLGYITVVNEDPEALLDVTVSFFISDYMEQAQTGARIERLDPREERKIPLYALLKEDILEITETTKITGKVLFSYTQQDLRKDAQQTTSVRLYDRNAMTWDDNQKAAAFISGKDPELLVISKAIAGMVREEGTDSLPAKLKAAVGLWEGMRAFGIRYVPDPKTPYVEFSKSVAQVDTLQFPGETMRYKAGDCDDLTILYCSLLQSVGIDTALLTIPGHIYMAFAPSLSPKDAEQLLLAEQTYFVRDDTVWIPVEITALQKDFLEASQIGFSQWKKNLPLGQAGFFPIEQAWQLYEPVGFVGGAGSIATLDSEMVGSLYRKSLARFLSFLVEPKAAALKNLLSSDPNSAALRSKLGLLYARFGMFPEAETEFGKALQQREDVSTLVNLGNLYYLRENFSKALEFYARAQKREPENARVLLALTRADIALGRMKEAEQLFTVLERVDPTLAAQYAHLRSQEPGGARAGSEAVEEKVTWVDD